MGVLLELPLTEEQELLRDTVRSFAQDELLPQAVAIDREARFPTETFRKMAELGFLGLPIPEEYEGSGVDTRTMTLVVEELAKCCGSTALGVGAFCFHPGAATAGDREAAVKRVSLAITRALEAIAGETRVLIENTAGAGLTVGKTPAEVGAMLDGVPRALRGRTGYGLDTCHLFSAGHDITASQAAKAPPAAR